MSALRKRVAVVQPVVVPGGGTEAVTAWTVEALKHEYEASLVSFSAISVDALNRYYGTQLAGAEVSLIRPNLPPFFNRTKRFLMLKDHLMMRYCKSVRDRFDLFISVGGAMDFGAPGIQYMALAPGSTLVKVLERDPEMPFWFHLLKRSFMRLSQLVSSYSQDRVTQNTTLVTSRWAGKLTERLYGIRHWEVVYPPVNTPAAKTPWSERESGFLCVARISPEKQIERAIEIVRRVRERGFGASLRIIGRQDNPHYLERVQRLCQLHASWIDLDGFLSREELGRLMGRYKYGINAAFDEPFGITLAEMVSAGCIVFVPDSGGQTEIEDDPRLAYGGVGDAVDKIARVLGNETLQQSLLSSLDDRRKAFSTHAFCAGIHRAVGQFFESGRRRLETLNSG